MYLERTLSRFQLHHPHQSVSLLISFPTTFYISLLKYISLYEGSLNISKPIKYGLFSEGAVRAFFHALIVNYKRFHFNEILDAYIRCRKSTDMLCAILEELSPKNFLVVLHYGDQNHDTIIRQVAVDPRLLKTILRLLTEEERILFLNLKDSSGSILFNLILNNPVLLDIIFPLISEDQRINVLHFRINPFFPVIHLLANDPVLLKTILGLIPTHKRMEVLYLAGERGHSVFYRALIDCQYKSYQLLETILAMVPKDKRIEAINARDGGGHVVLDSLIRCPRFLKRIMGLLTEDEIIDFLNTEIRHQETILHGVQRVGLLFEAVLPFVPGNKRLEILQVKNKDGSLPFYLIPGYPPLLHTMMNVLTEEERFHFLNIRDRDGRTVWDVVVDNPALLNTLLTWIPAHMRFEVIKTLDLFRPVPFFDTPHRTACFTSLLMILGMLPEDHRFELIKIIINYHHSWRSMISMSKSRDHFLRTLLSLIPENNHFELLTLKDGVGQHLLTCRDLKASDIALAKKIQSFEDLRYVIVRQDNASVQNLLVQFIHTKADLQRYRAYFNRQYLQLLDKLFAIADCAFGPSDTLLQGYIIQAKEWIGDLNNHAIFKAIDKALSHTFDAVHSPQMQVLNDTIRDYRKKAGIWMGGIYYEKLAQSIEGALCHMPLAQREQVLTGPNNPVQEVLSTSTFGFQLNPRALDSVKAKGLEQSSIDTSYMP